MQQVIGNNQYNKLKLILINKWLQKVIIKSNYIMDRQIIDFFLGGGVIVALIKIVGDWLNWWKPKEKADVRKIDSDIQVDRAEIDSKRAVDDANIAKVATDFAVQARVLYDKAILQTERAEHLVESLKQEKEIMREGINNLRIEFAIITAEKKLKIEELERALLIAERHIAEKEKECIALVESNYILTTEFNKYKENHG